MDLPWGDPRSTQFVTNVGLITTDGPNGPNIMSSEWTHHISYNPGLIAVCIRPGGATHENIRASKEFGVSLAATDQNVLASISGTNKGKETDKIAALKELGFKFSKARKIKALMVEGAVVNIECRLKQELPLGSHTVFVGEVIEATLNPGKQPLAYHQGRFWRLTEPIAKPAQAELDRFAKAVSKHPKK